MFWISTKIMEELQDASIHHTAAKLINTIKTLKNYEPLYENVQKLVCSPSVDRNDMCNTLEEAIKNAGLETEIRNIIFHLVRSRLKPEEKPSQINIVSIRTFRVFQQEVLSRQI
ncbi:uncharacterized protein LOC142242859 [Haematobia irritans]|uniref:uncharacterized protein LOC142242859 n=1 Tax=Haematobia irritans TaxID=7368 RepID=UPI003F4FFEDF